jgi:hypothetical protein
MGLFDMFRSKPSKEAVLGQVRKAKEVYAQAEYRRAAMEKLLKWGTEEALSGLLGRFSVVVQSPHWDEEEKRWLVDEMVKQGDKALPILRKFILEKNEVNHALMAYRKIINNDEAYKELLQDALNVRPPSDHRTVQGKQELIAAISEFPPESFDEILLPYMNDHSDDVQCIAIDALKKSEKEEVNLKLIELLKSEVHSARVLRTAANAVMEKKIHLGDNTKLSDPVREDFMIESGYLVKIGHKENH